MSRVTEKPTAKTADRYALYLASVQDPDHEVHMLRRVYRDAYRRDPRLLREDFCGTAAVCASWVRGRTQAHAWGVDLDRDTLDWGHRHNLNELTPAEKQRVALWQRDVRSPQRPKVDVVAAQNFSFQVFKTRPELREYFRVAHRNLDAQGVLLLDMMGGAACMEEDRRERRRIPGGFTYEWEQARFDPVSHHALFHINFHFRDGTRLRRAFTYDWRLWTMPEVRELLTEAGFRRSVVYWLEDYSEAGNSIYRQRDRLPAEPCWLTYVVGVK
ncbi:MAG: class I SAM-dependent methyltransferase [Deltaproteobacteria bacterium]|nr:class I SAM-dependent methyltransferase [Deltaproteobacteria bacterium]